MPGACGVPPSGEVVLADGEGERRVVRVECVSRREAQQSDSRPTLGPSNPLSLKFVAWERRMARANHSRASHATFNCSRTLQSTEAEGIYDRVVCTGRVHDAATWDFFHHRMSPAAEGWRSAAHTRTSSPSPARMVVQRETRTRDKGSCQPATDAWIPDANPPRLAHVSMCL